MGKASRRKRGGNRGRRFSVTEAPYLGPEPPTTENGTELCIQCKEGAVARVKDELSNKTVYRTSPFRVVNTPHGKRVIHDFCLSQKQKGLNGTVSRLR